MIHALFIIGIASLLFGLFFGMPVVEPYTGTIVDVINTLFSGIEIMNTAINVPLFLTYFGIMFVAETGFYLLMMYLAGVKILRS